jgi:hypothetical protein
MDYGMVRVEWGAITMKKTITIDAKQYKAAFRAAYGTGRVRGDWEERGWRDGFKELDIIIDRLSTGWTFDGEWKAPEKETKL